MQHDGAKRARGRPAKPEGEKFVDLRLKIDPDLRDELRRRVPHSERSEFIRSAVREALDRKGDPE